MIKDDLISFIAYEESLYQEFLILKEGLKVTQEYKSYVSGLIKLFKKYKNHPFLALELARALQLLSDDELLSEYQLSDLENLFLSQLKKSEWFLPEEYLEAAHFEYAVMNNSKKSLQIASKAKKKLKALEKEFDELLVKIKKENL